MAKIFTNQKSGNKRPNTPFVTVKPASSPWIRNIAHLFKSNNMWMYGSLAIILVLGVIVGNAITTPKSLETKATIGKAKISILPSHQTLPPDSLFQVWITADYPVAEANVEINFNPNLLKLTAEPDFKNTALANFVHVTLLSEANQTGKMVLTLELDPQNNTSPTGTFLLSTLKFGANTTAPNTPSAISINTSTVKIVQPDKNLFAISVADTLIVVNPTSQ